MIPDCDEFIADEPLVRLYEPYEPLPQLPAENFGAFVRRAAHPDSIRTLTTRQTEVGRMIGRCMSRKQIARVLGVRPVTVDAHCSMIREVLGVHSSTDVAIFFALRAVLLDGEGVQ